MMSNYAEAADCGLDATSLIVAKDRAIVPRGATRGTFIYLTLSLSLYIYIYTGHVGYLPINGTWLGGSTTYVYYMCFLSVYIICIRWHRSAGAAACGVAGVNAAAAGGAVDVDGFSPCPCPSCRYRQHRRIGSALARALLALMLAFAVHRRDGDGPLDASAAARRDRVGYLYLFI